MYNVLKDKMPNAEFIYGPMSREAAFNIPVQSYATELNGEWYAGTLVELLDFTDLEIKPGE